MTEKRKLENLSGAGLEMALEITERKSKPEKYDEHLVAFVDGSYFPPQWLQGENPWEG